MIDLFGSQDEGPFGHGADMDAPIDGYSPENPMVAELFGEATPVGAAGVETPCAAEYTPSGEEDAPEEDEAEIVVKEEPPPSPPQLKRRFNVVFKQGDVIDLDSD